MKKLIVLVVVGLIASGCNDYEKIISDARENKTKVGRQIIDGEEEPPFPDESENNKTLQGVDVNKNGIRDDVDIWINFVGKDRNHRMALKQIAKKLQKIMDVGGGNSKESKEQIVQEVYDADSCVSFFERGDLYEMTASSKVTDLLFNTNIRIDAYKKFHDRVLVYRSSKQGSFNKVEYYFCDFEVENVQKALDKNKKLGY